MDTLLEAIDIMLETHFKFRFLNGSPIGDSLSTKEEGMNHVPLEELNAARLGATATTKSHRSKPGSATSYSLYSNYKSFQES